MKTSFLEVFFILLIIGGPITVLSIGIYYLFCYLQEFVFLKPGDLILIHNQNLLVCIALIGITTFILIIFRTNQVSELTSVRLISLYNRIKVKYVIIISSILIISVLIIFFYNITVVSENGIRDRELLSQKLVVYTWEEVKEAKTFYTIEHGRSRIGPKKKFHYVLYLFDGKSFDLANAWNFKNKMYAVEEVLGVNNIALIKE